jgi:hypothetical protein
VIFFLAHKLSDSKNEKSILYVSKNKRLFQTFEFGYLNFVIPMIGLEIKQFYAINSKALSLFEDLFFLFFSKFEYVIISFDIF